MTERRKLTSRSSCRPPRSPAVISWPRRPFIKSSSCGTPAFTRRASSAGVRISGVGMFGKIFDRNLERSGGSAGVAFVSLGLLPVVPRACEVGSLFNFWIGPERMDYPMFIKCPGNAYNSVISDESRGKIHEQRYVHFSPTRRLQLHSDDIVTRTGCDKTTFGNNHYHCFAREAYFAWVVLRKIISLQRTGNAAQSILTHPRRTKISELQRRLAELYLQHPSGKRASTGKT